MCTNCISENLIESPASISFFFNFFFKLEDNFAIQQCESAISMYVCVYIYILPHESLPHEPPSSPPAISFLTRVLRS